MPVITLHSPLDCPTNEELLGKIANTVTKELAIPASHCWVLWNKIEHAYKQDWLMNPCPAPIVKMVCKQSHSSEKLEALLPKMKQVIALCEGCQEEEIFICVQKIERGHLLIRDEVWT
ncbi:MAG: 4-oxalocrotonate tautomerase [Shouchella clausii]|jgi:hypothetical protein